MAQPQYAPIQYPPLSMDVTQDTSDQNQTQLVAYPGQYAPTAQVQPVIYPQQPGNLPSDHQQKIVVPQGIAPGRLHNIQVPPRKAQPRPVGLKAWTKGPCKLVCSNCNEETVTTTVRKISRTAYMTAAAIAAANLFVSCTCWWLICCPCFTPQFMFEFHYCSNCNASQGRSNIFT